MLKQENLHKSIPSQMDHSPYAIQRQWPLLGQKLFLQEQRLTDSSGKGKSVLSEQKKMELRGNVRNALIKQLYSSEDDYSRDRRYLAFLLLKTGRGGEIVGDPYALEKGGKRQELPYTGLEGYYAGSQQTPECAGMTKEEIVQEEAKRGADLLHTLKEQVITEDTWTNFSHLQHVLAGGEPDAWDLRTLQTLWSTVIGQLHARVYDNEEFEPTLTEQIENIEQLLYGAAERTEEEKQLKNVVQAEYDRLKHEHEDMSEDEKAKERRERTKREDTRIYRLKSFYHFREETYHIRAQVGQGLYTLGIQDSCLENAVITETITLPKIPDRYAYPPTFVYLTPEHLEGYLFLCSLGEIGGDPLVRSTLVL